jgi:urea carboxylase-associated protein 2
MTMVKATRPKMTKTKTTTTTTKPRVAKSVVAAKVKATGSSPAPARGIKVSSANGHRATPDATGPAEVLRHGQGWSRVLLRGQILRITDTAGKACVSALFYNARNPIERYNVADTLKAQYTAFLTTGRVLYSDMGRVLVSIVGDSCGWHDTIGGCGSAATQLARFGAGDYQTLGNDFYRNARDNFIVELSKVGLGKRDIVANVNFFTRLKVDQAGGLSSVEGSSHPGAYVDLRADMDTLVVLSNTPPPVTTATEYPGEDVTVALAVRVANGRERSGPRDPCFLSRPENARGFALTAAYVAETERLVGQASLAT